jgi:hypothetical protein
MERAERLDPAGGARTLGSERGFSFDSGRELVLKGFSGPILVFELSPREH